MLGSDLPCFLFLGHSFIALTSEFVSHKRKYMLRKEARHEFVAMSLALLSHSATVYWSIRLQLSRGRCALWNTGT